MLTVIYCRHDFFRNNLNHSVNTKGILRVYKRQVYIEKAQKYLHNSK